MHLVRCQLTEVIFAAFVEFLVLNVYVQIPSNKMFWEESSDVQQQLVQSAMPWNKFCVILKNIHFCDNVDLDPADKCSKVRPHEYDTREMQKFTIMTKNVDVDESMIPYHGKFGQKILALALVLLLVWLNPYQRIIF